jgi:hypothetical protein
MNILTRNIADMTAKIDAHAAASDLLKQGRYYDADTGKGCFIGCLADGNDANFILSEYGLPVMLTRVLERICALLPRSAVKEFVLAIPRAVKTDGKDLSRVVWAFWASELRFLPPMSISIQVAINLVIPGMDLLAVGKQWPREKAKEARTAVKTEYLESQVGVEYAVAAFPASGTEAHAAYSGTHAAYIMTRAALGEEAEIREAGDTCEACAACAAYTAYTSGGNYAARKAHEEAMKRQRETILRLMSEAPVLEN